MSIYVITGGTTGIGAATREKLQEQGHEVFNIDYKGGDYTADLSTKEGRKGAIEAVYQRYPDGIDCFISNAGVGPTVPAATLFSLNYFAATELAEGLQPLLKKKRGNCVMTASNSITFPYVRQDWVAMLTNIHDEDSFTQIAQGIPPQAGPACYSTSKHALTRWMRRVSPSWAVEGTRINAVAPGNTTTPMTQNMTPEQKEAALLIPIPTRYGKKEFLDAEEIANGIIFLSSPMASGVNGTILFVDGGIDALLRSERF